MSEAVEQIAVHKLPLNETHRRLGASIVERDGWAVPAHYGNPSVEYEVIRKGGAGLLDLSSRARIEVSGSEAVQFLNGLITNDVKILEDGAWMQAAFPNAQGRLLANTRVLRRGSSFLIDTEAATHERVRQTLERFTLAGDFHVTDISDQTVMLSVQGTKAAEVIRTVLGSHAARTERGRVAVELDQRNAHPLTLIRATHTSEDGFDIIVSSSEAVRLWGALVQAGARPVGLDALEILRIEAGLPRYGVDIDETNVVLEAGLDDAVSFTKGCYIGQEIIARIHWRGHVAKRMAGLSFDDIVEPPRKAKVKAIDGKEIGRITSAAVSPRLNCAVALAIIKYDYLKPGTEVRVVHQDEERTAHVVELPFVRGSWYEAIASAESNA